MVKIGFANSAAVMVLVPVVALLTSASFGAALAALWLPCGGFGAALAAEGLAALFVASSAASLAAMLIRGMSCAGGAPLLALERTRAATAGAEGKSFIRYSGAVKIHRLLVAIQLVSLQAVFSIALAFN